jgi:hypothetical protein
MTSSLYVSINGQDNHTIRVEPSNTVKEIKSALMAAAKVASVKGDSAAKVSLKLYNSSGSIVPIGPHLPQNTPETRYNLVVKLGELFIGFPSCTCPCLNILFVSFCG